MKNVVSVIVLVSLLVVVNSACDKDTTVCRAVGSSDTAILITKKPVELFTNCSAIKAELVKKEDSRCPVDAACIWQGYVTVEIVLDNTFTVRLNNLQAKDTTYKSRQLNLKLADVLPYPRLSNTTPATTDTAKVVITMK